MNNAVNKTKHPLIIATGPHGFAGAGQIMSQNLRELSSAGCRVVYIGSEQPFLYNFIDSSDVEFVRSRSIYSDAIGDKRAVSSADVLFNYSLIEDIVEYALSQTGMYQQIILWGTYMFPYGYVSLAAKEVLLSYGIQASLWITPCGSDVWQIGRQLMHITKRILDSYNVDNVITYTYNFANEIKTNYNINRDIECIYPILDLSRFHPVSEDIKASLRRKLSIPESSFVIDSHSNMRPVKSPEDVIYIASAVAKYLPDRQIVLLMVGPKIEFNLELPGNLMVIQPGIVEKVEVFLWASDIELNCSWHDSFNLSLAEAMACGIPCISTNVVGIGQEITDSMSGFLFLYENPEASAKGVRYASAIKYILSLAQSEVTRKQLGENASRHAANTFCSQKILPMYFRLITSRSQ